MIFQPGSGGSGGSGGLKVSTYLLSSAGTRSVPFEANLAIWYTRDNTLMGSVEKGSTQKVGSSAVYVRLESDGKYVSVTGNGTEVYIVALG